MMGYILPYTEETYLSLVDGGGSPHAMRRSLSRRSTQDAIAEEGLEGDYEVGLWARGGWRVTTRWASGLGGAGG